MQIHPTLKSGISILLILFLLISSIHIVFALTVDTVIEYKTIEFQSPKVSPELSGYTVAFLTDTHSMTAAQLEEAVQKLNAYQVDLLLLGGDHSSFRDSPETTLQIVSKVETKDGIYGVEGNHDNRKTLFATMEKYGIQPLSNEGVALREGLYLAGTQDLIIGSPDVAKATQDAQQDDFILLLTHNPDTTMEQDTSVVNLTLSGHTHGGQVTFFGLWAPALTLTDMNTRYGQRFMAGWATSKDGTPVYTSRGAGQFPNTPRMFARPEITILTLQHSDATT